MKSLSATKCLLSVLLIANLEASAQLTWDEQHLFQDSQANPCSLLAATFHGQVLLPQDKAYSTSQRSYWSGQQADLKPACRFYPHSARDIQEALVDILIPHNVTIAVVSGGHSSNTGASNVDGGITIDLSRLDKISLSKKKEFVSIGPGARWEDVYSTLEPYNLTVSGGRVAHVGVGGYVLGGGFSWYANKLGWTCDSVLAFEVVTPQGEIMWVNSYNHEDLFWALKGSLGAFGIVTKVKLATISDPRVYGGPISYKPRPETLPKLFDALHNLNLQANNDPAQGGYLSFGWVEAKKKFTYVAYLINTDGAKDSQGVAVFKAIPHQYTNLRTTTVGLSAHEIDEGNPVGLRRAKFCLTATSDPAAMKAVHDLIRSSTSKLTFDRSGILGVTFQSLTLPHLRSNPRSNIFDLSGTSEALILIMAELWWSDETRDEYFEISARNLRIALEKELESLGVLQNWVYPNYAAKDQDPFASLAPHVRKMLKAIGKTYDPDDLWKRMVPGVWHI